jgi:hypothetical protein
MLNNRATQDFLDVMLLMYLSCDRVPTAFRSATIFSINTGITAQINHAKVRVSEKPLVRTGPSSMVEMHKSLYMQEHEKEQNHRLTLGGLENL